MKKVSIIAPVYNVEKYIKRCIDSILEQTYSDIEVILVDDGSKDSTGKICDEYAISDQRIKVVHKENGGLGIARNSGLEMATGDFVTFIDGDDSITNDHIKKMVKALEKDDADTCLAGHTKIYADSRVEHINVCAGKIFKGEEVKNEILTRMVGSNPDGSDYIEMSVCMVLLSKKIIDEFGLRFHSERDFISEDLIFDFDYYPRSKKAVVIDDVGYYYYDNEGSLTTKYNPKRFEKQKEMTREVIERAKYIGIYEKCEQRILNTFVSISRYCIKLEQKFSNNSYKTYKTNATKILKDAFLQKALTDIDNGNIPIKSRIVNIMMNRQWRFLLWLTMSFKNRYGI
ncbi:glycosyl transferase family 2 [Hungatella effluvii]|uniref:Glycosyl transferase family 2 n=1 Tax=Hungatella effluvii TaxID=1096246 RepID=A0A2V3Y799_9FIRM|nr:glycosyltransferase family 2 protein [Hungatella effluvii]PXX52508.1 glycosyl transferase family 2 [Hungatella effluvii]